MSSETTFGDWTDTGNGTTLNKLVDGLMNGTSYVFEVRAKNSAGSGHISNSATATPIQPVAPSAPTWLIADPGDGEVPLSWTKPSSFGTTPLNYYEYCYATGEQATDADYTSWDF